AEGHRDAVRHDARGRRGRCNVSRRLPELQRSRRHLQDQRTRALLISFLALSGVEGSATTAAAQTSPGVVGEVRVHGNHTTPNADILAIVGDVVGKPATDALITEITKKLEKSGRFDGVEVRKRFRSIENPDDILLMVIVDEFPGIDEFDITGGKVPGPVGRFWGRGMVLPIRPPENGHG